MVRLFVVNIITACLIIIGSVLTAFAQNFGSIKPPVVYSGESSGHRSFLYLGKKSDFFLHEEIVLFNGKISAWETTGKWYQIRGGAFVQLTNAKGFYRLINVGGDKDLYLDAHLSAAQKITVNLKEQPLIPLNFSISGRLHVDEDSFLLEDYDSGVFHSVTLDDISIFAKKCVSLEETGSHVRADVFFLPENNHENALRIKDIQCIQAKKQTNFHNTPHAFTEFATGIRWKFIKNEYWAPNGAYFVFIPNNGKEDGILDVFDGERYETGSYSWLDHRLSLSIKVSDARFADLIKKIDSWQMTGEILELWGDNKILGVLEQ